MSSYCTPAELRTQIGKTGTTGDASDAALRLIIEAVSNSIDGFCNRVDGFVAGPFATTRVYSGDGSATIRIDECVAITTVSAKDSATDSTYTAWASTDWIPFTGSPDQPDFNSLPYTGLMTDPNGDYSSFTGGQFSGRRGFRPIAGLSRSVPTVRVVARWGYGLDAPPVVRQATIALAARWFKEGQGAWSDTLASADFGQLIYKAQNADIKFMLENARLLKPALGTR